MKRIEVDWSQIDWQKTTREIADEVGVSVATVTNYRSRYAPETKRKTSLVDWSKVDWSKSTSQIVQETGVEQSNVSKARRRHAPETIREINCDFGNVDWSQSNKAIAEKLGVSYSYACHMRRKHAPETIARRKLEKRWGLHEVEEEFANENRDEGEDIFVHTL